MKKIIALLLCIAMLACVLAGDVYKRQGGSMFPSALVFVLFQSFLATRRSADL